MELTLLQLPYAFMCSTTSWLRLSAPGVTAAMLMGCQANQLTLGTFRNRNWLDFTLAACTTHSLCLVLGVEWRAQGAAIIAGCS